MVGRIYGSATRSADHQCGLSCCHRATYRCSDISLTLSQWPCLCFLDVCWSVWQRAIDDPGVVVDGEAPLTSGVVEHQRPGSGSELGTLRPGHQTTEPQQRSTTLSSVGPSSSRHGRERRSDSGMVGRLHSDSGMRVRYSDGACKTPVVDHVEVPEDPPGLLVWLQGWYSSLCDGDWEHAEAIHIGTLDNPGWRVRIPLVATCWETKPFERTEVQRDEHDWVHAWVEDGFYHSACGPTNLSEALFIFREWISA